MVAASKKIWLIAGHHVRGGGGRVPYLLRSERDDLGYSEQCSKPPRPDGRGLENLPFLGSNVLKIATLVSHTPNIPPSRIGTESDPYSARAFDELESCF